MPIAYPQAGEALGTWHWALAEALELIPLVPSAKCLVPAYGQIILKLSTMVQRRNLVYVSGVQTPSPVEQAME